MILAITITMVALMGIGVVSTIFMIGKPRQPITSGTAAATLVINGLMIAGVLVLAGN
jgi:hypothetical protein